MTWRMVPWRGAAVGRERERVLVDATQVVRSRGQVVGRSLRVTFSAALVRRLGWRTGDRLRVEVGRETDAGRLRVARAPADDVEPGWRLSSTAHGAHLRLNLGRFRAADGAPRPSRPTAHRVAGGAVYVDLPDWVEVPTEL